MDSEEERTDCQQCGEAMHLDDFAAICPACLLEGISGLVVTQLGENRGQFQVPLAEDLELIFPEFSVLRLIGRGGMGAVYEAYHEELERAVALKILPEETSCDLEFRERFRQEAATLALLDHPGIVRLYDYGERQGYFYITMEYVEGRDLSALMSDEPRDFEFVSGLMSQLAAALQNAHENGIVHRDIKPGNLLLTDSGALKVVDFGLAKVLHDLDAPWALTRTQTRMGTPQYMAPEQLSPGSEIDHRADIYSVGVLLYELLTGKKPVGNFAKPSQENGKLRRHIDAVILRALRPDPGQRFQSMEDFLEAFQSRNWSRLLIGGALVLAAGVLVFASSRKGEKSPETVAASTKVEFAYRSDSSAGPDPSSQGWVALEVQLGEGGNVRPADDEGEVVWRIDDCLTEAALNLPSYRGHPEDPEEVVRRLFEQGWELTFTYRVVEQSGSSDYAAFCGWRVSSRIAPEEWGITEGKSARLGFYLGRSYQWSLRGRKYRGDFISRDLTGGPQLGQERRSSAFTASNKEPAAWHTVRMIGEARSPRYDWYVDGEYAGSGRVSDEEKADTKEPLHVVFYSGSPGEIHRVTDWKEVVLRSGSSFSKE